MKSNRRTLLKTVLFGGALLGMNTSLMMSFAAKEHVPLIILHTNYINDHIDPVPNNDTKYTRMGLLKLAYLIKDIRNN